MTDPATVAYYLRLSRTDGDLGKGSKKESNSIENQRKLLEEFQRRRPDLGGDPEQRSPPPHREYVDDGYTGANFQRPGFQRLLTDCRKGLVSTILVKDMSRLGRNYIDVGDYVEQIFPLLRVRFISVADRFDTAVSGTTEFSMAVENLVNTFYAKDYTKKSRSARRAKWKEGLLTSIRTPLGYICDDRREGWKIDPGGAEIVRTIFAEAEKGNSTGMIADTLNRRQIPTPYLYLKSAGRWTGTGKVKAPEEQLLWTASMVWSVLRNETYTGKLFQGKRDTLFYGSTSSRKVSREKQYITEDAHEAIVSQETFQNAQKVIRPTTAGAYQTDLNYALKGFVMCGNCRRRLQMDCGILDDVMYCRSRTLEKSSCSREDFRYDILEGVALAAIRQMRFLCGTMFQKVEVQVITEDTRKDRIRLGRIRARKAQAYKEYRDGQLTREQFQAERERLTAQITELEGKLAEAEKQKEVVTENPERVSTAGEKETLSRDMVKALIQGLYVYDGRHMEVAFRCEDLFRGTMGRA